MNLRIRIRSKLLQNQDQLIDIKSKKYKNLIVYEMEIFEILRRV